MSDDLSDDEGTSPDDALPRHREDRPGMPGFVPPEQRSWVHPSELRAAASGPGGPSPTPMGPNVFSVNPPTPPHLRGQTRRRTIGAMAIGMTAACGVLAVITLLDTPARPGEDGSPEMESASLVVATSLPTSVAPAAWIGLEGHRVKRWTGVALQVTAVTKDGPADDAQIEPGDVLVSIDDHPVGSMADLRTTLSDFRAENTVELVVWRAGKQREVNVILAPPPAA